MTRRGFLATIAALVAGRAVKALPEPPEFADGTDYVTATGPARFRDHGHVIPTRPGGRLTIRDEWTGETVTVTLPMSHDMLTADLNTPARVHMSDRTVSGRIVARVFDWGRTS